MDFDHRLENRSYATVRTFATMDREGFDVCLTVAKIAFRLSAQGQARLGFRPVRPSPFWDGGTLRFPHDCAEEKPGTDIGLVGTAHPTASRDSKHKNAAFAWVQAGLGGTSVLRKVIQIFGPRVYSSNWGELAISEAAPLGPTPLSYDLCYGGIDHDGTPHAENPIGRGFAKDKSALNGKPAPQLEPVNEMIQGSAQSAPAHATFGPIPEHWEPRIKRGGTYDSEWLAERYPIVPQDFDPRHHNWATPGLHSNEPLNGDEPIEVAGVIPEGVWRFKLPLYPIRFEVVLDGVTLGPPTHLDGLLIDADERVVELTWRATTRLPLKWEKLEAIRVLGMAKLPKEMLNDEEWPKAS